jgi:hypothetical protein
VTERLPRPDSALIERTVPRRGDILVIAAGDPLVRIHQLGGPHPVAWNEFRAWGPTRSRFDHHTLPRRVQDRRVAYLTRGRSAFSAALAEYFQDNSGGVLPINVSSDRTAVTVIQPSRSLRLLNLDSGWVTRAGGNQAIRTGSRAMAREWSRAIYRHHDIDGVAYSSSVWGPGRCVALWERAESAMPSAPTAHRMLDDPAIIDAVAAAAADLGTALL